MARRGHDARLSSSIGVARSSASPYDDEASLPLAKKSAFAQKLRGCPAIPSRVFLSWHSQNGGCADNIGISYIAQRSGHPNANPTHPQNRPYTTVHRIT